jgi:flagellar protein FliO/FliZ
MKRAFRVALLLPAWHALAAAAALPTVPSAAAAPTPSAAGGLLQAGFGLVVVLALVFACAWVVRRLGLPVTGGGRQVKVVASAAVGQRERVVVVEVGGECLVLGVAAGSVRHLHTLPAGALAPQVGQAASAPSGFDGALFAQKLRATLAQRMGRTG